jgi:glycosyltransferase involved in cell wall biosynthesis
MVSILLASYNGENYIRSQIDSVLSQTFKELTLVISDDLSTDQTPTIIREYQTHFPDQIIILNNEKRSGSAQNNFFRLLTSVTDDYLMLCDQDDVWIPDKVQITWKVMERMELKYGKHTPILIHSDLSVTDRKGNMLHSSIARHQKIAVKDNRLSHYLVENNITGNTVMINQAFRKYVSNIPKECVMHDWWLGLLAACFGKIAYINKPLVHYRQHEGNQVGSRSGLEQLTSRFHNQKDVRENYQKLFRQAEVFYEEYEKKLSNEQRETFLQFINLPKKNRLEKMYIIWRYQFMKSTPFRTLGQMLSI